MGHILLGDNTQLEITSEVDFQQNFHNMGSQIWYCDLQFPCTELMLILGKPGINNEVDSDRVAWKFKIVKSFGETGRLKDKYYFYMHDNDVRPMWIKDKWILFSRSKRGINCFWRVINDYFESTDPSKKLTYKIMNPAIKVRRPTVPTIMDGAL